MSTGESELDAPEPEHHQPDITKLTQFLQEPLHIQSVALTGLFVLASFYTLYFARTFLLPMILALLLSFLLAPVVRALKQFYIPEALGAALVLLVMVGGVGYGVYQLSGPAAAWMAKVPQSFYQIQYKLRVLKKSVEQVTKATEQVEKITKVDEGKQAPVVEVKQPSLGGTLFNQTQDVIAGAVVMLVLLYFLLASGDFFLRKLISVLPRLSDKKRAVEIAREIEGNTSLYLFTVTLINSGLGVLVGLALFFIGMPNPVLWGVMATLLNFIPYLGAMVGLIVLTLAAILTFEDIGQALLVPGVYFCVTALEGNFITPTIIGRRLTLNPVAIFISAIFWGWMWGIAGILLAVPILATFKIFCDHIEPLAPIGEFLGQ